MKRLVQFLAVATILFYGGSVGAQNIAVQDAKGQLAIDFVNGQLLGDGVYVYNVKYWATHDTILTENIGTFNANGYSNLGMDKGIILASGKVQNAVGPNTDYGSESMTSPYWADTVMNKYVPGGYPVTTCATLDFDFICASNVIQLQYVFGSEEWEQYSHSSFNDIFGFLVSGPHPDTGEDSTWNIAILPNSVTDSTPLGISVSIGNVNQDDNTTYYQSFYPPANQPGVQYNGLTNKLGAFTTLNPCTPYHLHISCCNVSDHALGSAVFLEKGCLTSAMGTPGLSRFRPDTIRKACPIDIPLTLSNTAFENGVDVIVNFSGSAINGQDYICKYNGVPLQSGDSFHMDSDTSHLYFQSLTTSNNPKSVVASFATGICANYPQVCTHDTMRFVIYGDNNIKVKEKTITAEKVVTYVSAELESGTPPINFQWVPGDDILFPFLQSSPADIWTSRDYQVIAYDNQRCYFDTGIVHIVITGNNPNPNGIDEVGEDGINLYPNPVDNMLHIDAEGLQRLELYSIMGSKVYDVTVAAENQKEIDMSALAPGTYALRITTPEGVFVRKVVKK